MGAGKRLDKRQPQHAGRSWQSIDGVLAFGAKGFGHWSATPAWHINCRDTRTYHEVHCQAERKRPSNWRFLGGQSMHAADGNVRMFHGSMHGNVPMFHACMWRGAAPRHRWLPPIDGMQLGRMQNVRLLNSRRNQERKAKAIGGTQMQRTVNRQREKLTN